ncbi:MAG: phospholipase D family protein [Thiobacillaceae bacterium]|nr:phospholipase D family protein [Thiobacillaceae bacterium]
MTARGGIAWLVLLAALLQAGCASLPTDVQRPPSAALTDTADTRLGQTARRLLAGHPDDSAVLLLGQGTDAFLARLALADVAEKSLDVQYYIWHGDTTGKVLADRLLRAADRGVRVRVLLDDIGTAADDARLLALDSHPNIEVRLFNPVANRSFRMLGMLADFSRVNRRMHNKSFTADNQATIVGGRNIGDEYFAARPDVEFADLDLLALGPAVPEVSSQFDRYWNSPAVYPITALSTALPSDEAMIQGRAELREFVESQRGQHYARALSTSGLARGLTEGSLGFAYGKVRVLADDPAKVEQASTDEAVLLLPRLRPEFESLKSELVLVSPYFVPGEKGTALLRDIMKRGVRVRILTNSLAATDVPAVHAGYQKYRRELLEAGAELYELKPTAPKAERADSDRESQQGKDKNSFAGSAGSSHASLHAKSLAFDRHMLFVGSMNLDPRSVLTNTEIGVLLDHPELVAAQAEKLEAQLSANWFRLELVSPAPDAVPAIQWVEVRDGVTIRHTREPLTTAWQRFKIQLLSLLPIESYL